MPGSSGPTLVCSGCRRRLNAAGAAPGRRGRCPSCGAVFRVPDDAGPAPAGPTLARAPAPLPSPTEPERSPPVEEAVLPERAPASMHSSSFVAARAEARSGLIGRGGLLPPPSRPESTSLGTFLYPIWDLAGLAWMISLGAGLSTTGVIVFGLIPLVLKGGNVAVMGPFAFAMIVPFVLILGYTLQVFSDILITAAAGEVVHPRWPDIDIFSMLGMLSRWILALGPGVAIGIGPLIREWIRWGSLGMPRRLVLASWLGVGLSFCLMGLASMLLHDDIRAINPLRVIRDVARVGLACVAPCLLTIAASVLSVLALEVVYLVSNFFLMLFAAWAFCALVIYEGMVISRSLGLCCLRSSGRLGWFPERARWGVRR